MFIDQFIHTGFVKVGQENGQSRDSNGEHIIGEKFHRFSHLIVSGMSM